LSNEEKVKMLLDLVMTHLYAEESFSY